MLVFWGFAQQSLQNFLYYFLSTKTDNISELCKYLLKLSHPPYVLESATPSPLSWLHGRAVELHSYFWMTDEVHGESTISPLSVDASSLTKETMHFYSSLA